MDNYYLVKKPDPSAALNNTAFKYYLASARDVEDKASDDIKQVIFGKEICLCLSGSHEANHVNPWQYVYNVRFDGGNISVFWMKYIDKNDKMHYQRFIYYDLLNPEYKTEYDDKWYPLISIWGNPNVLYFKNKRLISRFGLAERTFNSEEEVREDYLKHSEPSLEPLFDEIFADG